MQCNKHNNQQHSLMAWPWYLKRDTYQERHDNESWQWRRTTPCEHRAPSIRHQMTQRAVSWYHELLIWRKRCSGQRIYVLMWYSMKCCGIRSWERQKLAKKTKTRHLVRRLRSSSKLLHYVVLILQGVQLLLMSTRMIEGFAFVFGKPCGAHVVKIAQNWIFGFGFRTTVQ
jgi:hypothetical protein